MPISTLGIHAREKKHAILDKFILGTLFEDIGGIYINLLFNITIWLYHVISPNFMMIEPHKTHIFLSSGWAPLGFKHDLPVKLPKSPELRGLEGPEPQLQGERPGHRCGQRRLERVQRPQRRPEVQQGASEAFFLQRFLGCNADSYGSTFMCFLHIMFFFFRNSRFVDDYIIHDPVQYIGAYPSLSWESRAPIHRAIYCSHFLK